MFLVLKTLTAMTLWKYTKQPLQPPGLILEVIVRIESELSRTEFKPRLAQAMMSSGQPVDKSSILDWRRETRGKQTPVVSSWDICLSDLSFETELEGSAQSHLFANTELFWTETSELIPGKV